MPRALRNSPIPSLVIQPLVENAVKHGVAPSVPGGHVSLEASLVDAWKSGGSKSVRNTGAPLQILPPSGMGLANVERRLAGHYDQRRA